MNYWEMAAYLLLFIGCISSPILKDAVFFILWPLRLPIMMVGYLFMWVNYLILKLFDPRSVDIMYAGCVEDGVTGHFLKRVWSSLKLSFQQKKAIFTGSFGLRQQGFVRATIGQFGFENLKERQEIADEESELIIQNYLSKKEYVRKALDWDRHLTGKLNELNKLEKKQGIPLTKMK